MTRLPAGPFLSLISDERSDAARVVAVVEAACAAGCRLVQLRRQEAPTDELVTLAVRLCEITRRHDALLAINDRIDVALAAGADAVHLPAAGMTPVDARRVLDGARGARVLVGRSVHAIDEIRALADSPLDYLQFGPVFATASKARYGPPQGLARMNEAVAAAADRPLVAVGGITAANIADVLGAGAAGAAVIGAVMNADDAGTATDALIAALSRGAPLR